MQTFKHIELGSLAGDATVLILDTFLQAAKLGKDLARVIAGCLNRRFARCLLRAALLEEALNIGQAFFQDDNFFFQADRALGQRSVLDLIGFEIHLQSGTARARTIDAVFRVQYILAALL